MQNTIVTGLRRKGKRCAVLSLCQFEQPRAGGEEAGEAWP